MSDDKSVRLWKCEEERVGARKDPKWNQSCVILEHHSRTIFSVSWSKVHGYIATVGGDNVIKILKEENGQLQVVCEASLPLGGNEVNSIAWCPLEANANLLATGGDDGLIRIWRLSF